MRRILLVLLLLTPALAWSATFSCLSTPRGTLQLAKVVQGASTNSIMAGKRDSVGFQAHITAGTATASIQACCRTHLGTTGCDGDEEWQDLGGCVQALSAAGTRNMLCPASPPVACLYRGFIATATCASCSVDFTYACGEQ